MNEDDVIYVCDDVGICDEEDKKLLQALAVVTSSTNNSCTFPENKDNLNNKSTSCAVVPGNSKRRRQNSQDISDGTSDETEGRPKVYSTCVINIFVTIRSGLIIHLLNYK